MPPLRIAKKNHPKILAQCGLIFFLNYFQYDVVWRSDSIDLQHNTQPKTKTMKNNVQDELIKNSENAFLQTFTFFGRGFSEFDFVNAWRGALHTERAHRLLATPDMVKTSLFLIYDK